MAGFDMITIARQFGAGGSEIAAAVGGALGWRVLDREILRSAATDLHAEEGSVAAVDEHAWGTLERAIATFLHGGSEPVPDPTYDIDPDTVAGAVHAVVRAAARATPVVIVGHGAQCIFGARPATLHVRVVAPFEPRARRVADRESLPIERARDEVQRRDRQRERYLRHHFGCDPAEGSLYSMQVNTARMPIEHCVAAILAVMRST